MQTGRRSERVAAVFSPPPTYKVDADKGFNYTPCDDAFVCQKKNHFQISVQCGFLATPKFVRPPESDGAVRVDAFYIHFYGIKVTGLVVAVVTFVNYRMCLYAG